MDAAEALCVVSLGERMDYFPAQMSDIRSAARRDRAGYRQAAKRAALRQAN